MFTESEAEKVDKLMRLAVSTSPNEADSAVKAANRILLKCGTTWSEVLESHVMIKGGDKLAEIFAQGWSACEQQIEANKKSEIPSAYDMFTFLDTRITYGQDEFYDSLRQNYVHFGKLSEKQTAHLFKKYQSHKLPKRGTHERR